MQCWRRGTLLVHGSVFTRWCWDPLQAVRQSRCRTSSTVLSTALVYLSEPSSGGQTIQMSNFFNGSLSSISLGYVVIALQLETICFSPFSSFVTNHGHQGIVVGELCLWLHATVFLGSSCLKLLDSVAESTTLHHVAVVNGFLSDKSSMRGLRLRIDVRCERRALCKRVCS